MQTADVNDESCVFKQEKYPHPHLSDGETEAWRPDVVGQWHNWE